MTLFNNFDDVIHRILDETAHRSKVFIVFDARTLLIARPIEDLSTPTDSCPMSPTVTIAERIVAENRVLTRDFRFHFTFDVISAGYISPKRRL